MDGGECRMNHGNVELKQWHIVANLLPAPSSVCLKSTGKYHSRVSWLPANISVSHAHSPICTLQFYRPDEPNDSKYNSLVILCEAIHK